MFRPDPTIYDGRFANNAWLQELPKPMTQADLGQRGAGRPGDGAKAGAEERRHGRDRRPRAARSRARYGFTPGQPDNSVTVSWATGARGRTRGQRRGFQRLSAAHLVAAAAWSPVTADSQDGRAVTDQLITTGHAGHGEPAHRARGDAGRSFRRPGFRAESHGAAAGRARRSIRNTTTRAMPGAWPST